MDNELNANIKADLISIGSVQVDKSLLPDQLKSKATAGPGAGGVLNLSQVRKQTGEAYNQ